jgi:hypothetical protein
VELDVELALHRHWLWLIAEDVTHCAVVHWSVLVRGVEVVFIVLQ